MKKSFMLLKFLGVFALSLPVISSSAALTSRLFRFKEGQATYSLKKEEKIVYENGRLAIKTKLFPKRDLTKEEKERFKGFFSERSLALYEGRAKRGLPMQTVLGYLQKREENEDKQWTVSEQKLAWAVVIGCTNYRFQKGTSELLLVSRPVEELFEGLSTELDTATMYDLYLKFVNEKLIPAIHEVGLMDPSDPKLSEEDRGVIANFNKYGHRKSYDDFDIEPGSEAPLTTVWTSEKFDNPAWISALTNNGFKSLHLIPNSLDIITPENCVRIKGDDGKETFKVYDVDAALHDEDFVEKIQAIMNRPVVDEIGLDFWGSVGASMKKEGMHFFVVRDKNAQEWLMGNRNSEGKAEGWRIFVGHPVSEKTKEAKEEEVKKEE